jgi:hypothetical protein
VNVVTPLSIGVMAEPFGSKGRGRAFELEPDRAAIMVLVSQ